MQTLIEKLIEYIVTYFWSNLLFWQLSGITLFIVLLSILTFRNRIITLLHNEPKIAHDQNIFNKADSLMNEQQFSEFVDTLGTCRFIGIQSKRADRYRHFFREVGNQFLDSKIEKQNRKFLKKLDELFVLTVTHFFDYPNSQGTDPDDWQYALYPEILHGTPDTDEYQMAMDCQKKLFKILDEIIVLYRKYRTLVKQGLTI